MDKIENNKDFVIDIMHILKTVWQKIWVVIIASFAVAAIAFSYASFFVTPTYSSSVMLYVNNSSFNVGDLGFSISSSQIMAAQSLAKTYTVMLKNRTTIQRLIEETGLDYSWQKINSMIEANPVNETEIMRVTVTCENPYEAEKIANGIAKVLPQRISEIIEGASMEVVDSAVAATDKVAPSITKYTALGFMLGAFLSVLVLVLISVMDKTIHDEEYVINTYHYPILATIPNLMETNTKKYAYYKKGYYKSTYYKSSSTNNTDK